MGSLVLNVEILGEFKKLTQATKGAEGKLDKFSRSAKDHSRKINRAFGAIGIGLSLAALTRGLTDSAKAAYEDERSQKLLASQLKLGAKATDEQIKGSEKFISTMQGQTGVLDDNLRPAFAKLARGTGSVTKAQKLLKVALDVAKGTGKPLATVVDAISKAYNGNKTSLNKLVPELKNSKDQLGGLADKYKDLATIQADPFEKLKAGMTDIQEQIGTVFLPYLEPATKKITELFKKIQDPKTKEGKAFTQLKETLGKVADAGAHMWDAITDKGKSDDAMSILEGILAIVNGIADGIKFASDSWQGFMALMSDPKISESYIPNMAKTSHFKKASDLPVMGINVYGEKVRGSELLRLINAERRKNGMPPLK
jgi:flagellar biosynthesis chaperone FliJ